VINRTFDVALKKYCRQVFFKKSLVYKITPSPFYINKIAEENDFEIVFFQGFRG